MKSSLILTGFFFLLLVPVFTQTSDEELKLGVAAYKDNHYDQAIEHFEKATQLDPGHINAHLYLATACVSLYIPGINTDDNKAFAEKAIAHYSEGAGSEFRYDPKGQQREGHCLSLPEHDELG